MDRDLAIGADLHGLGHNTKASQMGGLQPLSRKKDSGIDEIICFFTKDTITRTVLFISIISIFIT